MKNNQVRQPLNYQELWIKYGEEFENDVADEFFPDETYEMLDRTHSFNANRKRFIRSSLNPDFHFEIRELKKDFWVECKFRENKQDLEFIKVFKTGQLERYMSFKRSFLLLCTKRQRIQYLYLVPIKHIKGDILHFSFLEPYRLKHNPPVRPGVIIKFLR
jgi:hypothetical protein